jgi:putative membrane protein
MCREAVFDLTEAADHGAQQPRVDDCQPAPRAAILLAMKVLVRWLLLAAALLLVAHLYSGVQVASFGSAMVGALVLGLLNTLVRPLLVLLTLPVTLLTLGLFLFVINALMFWMAGSVLSGFQVASFGAALIGSLIYSLCGMFIDVAVERLFSSVIR